MKKLGFVIVCIVPLVFLIASWQCRVTSGISVSTCLAGVVMVAISSMISYKIRITSLDSKMTILTKLVVLALCTCLISLAIKVNIPADAYMIMLLFGKWGIAFGVVVGSFSLGVMMQLISFFREQTE